MLFEEAIVGREVVCLADQGSDVGPLLFMRDHTGEIISVNPTDKKVLILWNMPGLPK